MSEPSRPQIPRPPEFASTADPFIENIFGLSQGLTGGQFLDPSSQLGFLSPLVTTMPDVTRQAVGLATRDIERTRDIAQRNIVNQLEASGQLTSSTAVNRLADLNEQFGRDIADVNTQFFLADVERSLGNIGGLFELGTGLAGQAGQLGLESQRQRNQFALSNFPNRVAFAEAQQGPERGGILGGLSGGLGGAALGLALAPFTGGSSLLLAGGGGLLGGLAGGFGGPQTGPTIFSGGLGLAGNNLGQPATQALPQQADLSEPAFFRNIRRSGIRGRI